MEVPADPHHSTGSFASEKRNNLSGRQWHDEYLEKDEIGKNLANFSGERDLTGMNLNDHQNVQILDEIGSLCSECRLDEEEEAKKAEAKHLDRKLAELVDGMNRAEILRQKMATEEELKMEQKKAKEEEEQKWAEQNEIWKEELEELKREKMKEKLAETDALGEEWMASKMWPERSGTKSNLESIWSGDEQRGKTKRLREQLRRNEALKRSIDRLEQFKKQEKEEHERISEMEMINRRMKNDLLLGEKKKMLLRRQNSLDRQFGSREFNQSSTNPTVFEAWKKAREAHEKRYRILQDVEEYGRGRGIGKIGMEHVIERKRCRKCKKPISVRQFVRQSRNE